MADQQVLDEQEILRIIQEWPRDRQVDLAHRILDPGLRTLDPKTGRPYVSSAQMRGIASGDRPAPTDEEIERWRAEKYDE